MSATMRVITSYLKIDSEAKNKTLEPALNAPGFGNRKKNFYKFMEESKKNGYSSKTLGMVNDFPILLFTPDKKHAKNVLVATAFHGEEPAGFYAILSELKNLGKYDNINISLLPLPNPVGFFLCRREGVSGEEPNRGFKRITTDTEKLPVDDKGEKPTPEGQILLDHKKELVDLGRDGFISIHEDDDSKNSYVFTFEKGSKPGEFSHVLLDALRGHFPKKGKTKDIEYKVHDGSFEDMMAKEGVPYSACTETPSCEKFEDRIEANKSVLHAFLQFMNHE